VEAAFKELGGTGVFVCSGHPGIGKTAFLYILLAYRLRKRFITVFELPEVTVLFNGDGVFRVSEKALWEDLQGGIPYHSWILVDASIDFSKPHRYLMYDQLNLFFVLASSPRESHWNSWDMKPRKKFFFMMPWTWVEIVQA